MRKYHHRKFAVTEEDFKMATLLKDKISENEVAAIIKVSPFTVKKLWLFPNWEAYCQEKKAYAERIHQAELQKKQPKQPEVVVPEVVVETNLDNHNGISSEDKFYHILVSIEAKISKLLLLEERKVAYHQDMAEKKKKLFGGWNS